MKQTGKMARAVLLLLLAGCLLGLTACGSKEPVAGFYQVDYELPIN